MADEVDIAQEREQMHISAAIEAALAKAAELDPGKAGECDLCGEWSARLIRGACAPCRDRYKLP